MYELTADKAKKRIYLRIMGFIQDKEIHELVKRVNAEVDAMPSGFDLINDITEFKPATPEGAKEMQTCVKYAYQHGLHHVMRVVGTNAISRMQFNRLAITTGSASVTEEVSSREEAEKRLDELIASSAKAKPKK